ncbi:MAG: heavy metal translocating P-type ATPase [Magnetococcales bacterium]|nr:heavy metal translocating P-type ATPase [Magnetococcales bacterium]
MYAARLIHELPRRMRFRLLPPNGKRIDCDDVKACLESREGITEVRVSAVARSLTIHHDGARGRRDQVALAVARLPSPSATETSASDRHLCLKPSEEISPALSGLILLASPFLPRPLAAAITWLNIAPTLLLGARTLLDRGVKVEVLDALAVGVSAWRGEYPTANTTQFLLRLGEYLQNSTERRSEDLVKSLLLPLPTHAWVERNGTLIRTPTSAIAMGDLVEVGTGDPIPVDGEVVEGLAMVNQASLTGESLPVAKKPGDGAISGTLVTEGRIRVRAVRVGDHTVIARIGHFITDSLRAESTTQRLAARLADRRVLFTFAMGAMVFAATRDPRRMASTLLVDFACGIKISTPVAFKSAMYLGGTQGILFKGGEAIENLALADTFAFDKTGTLTSGRLEVTGTRLFDPKWDESRLLTLVASLEEHSTHPVAAAIVQEANKRALPHMRHGVVDLVVAHGLQSTMDDQPILVGSRHFLEEDSGISFQEHDAILRELTETGHMLLLVARARRPLGLIALRDHLREETVAVLRDLRALGVKRLIMLTGDHRLKATQLGEALGMDAIHYELVPGDKHHIVQQLKQAGARVALVGDGINDAPALAAADVGIAMPGGAELTRNTADIALLRDQLTAIVEARRLAMNTMELVRNNFRIALGVNGAILSAATLGALDPVATSILHNGTTLAILLNSLSGIDMSREHSHTVLGRMRGIGSHLKEWIRHADE